MHFKHRMHSEGLSSRVLSLFKMPLSLFKMRGFKQTNRYANSSSLLSVYSVYSLLSRVLCVFFAFCVSLYIFASRTKQFVPFVFKTRSTLPFSIQLSPVAACVSLFSCVAFKATSVLHFKQQRKPLCVRLSVRFAHKNSFKVAVSFACHVSTSGLCISNSAQAFSPFNVLCARLLLSFAPSVSLTALRTTMFRVASCFYLDITAVISLFMSLRLFTHWKNDNVPSSVDASTFITTTQLFSSFTFCVGYRIPTLHPVNNRAKP